MSERHSYPVYWEAPGVFVEVDTHARVNTNHRPWPVDPREHVLNPRKRGRAYSPEHNLFWSVRAAELAMKEGMTYALYADTKPKRRGLIARLRAWLAR